jgi:hypothetical protein
MSTTSPQAKAAGENASWQAGLANQLSGVALPELQMLLGGGAMGQMGMLQQMLAGRGLSGMLPQDQANLKQATGALNQGYQQAGFGMGQTIGYGGLRSGEGRMSPGAMNASLGSAMTTLERQRQGALSNLNFMSAQASMNDYNKLLGLMGQGVQTSLGLAQGFSGASNAALGGMSQQTEMGNFLSGLGTAVGIAGVALA